MAPRLDHNETGGLGPDTFLRLYRELRQARMPMETAVSNYRTALKRLKDGGVDTFALSVLEKLVKVEEDQAGLHIRNLFKYADWTGANVGLKQPDLFGGTDGQAPAEEASGLFAEQLAEEHGFRTGKARERGDLNPHPAGSAQHAAWARGWNRGQAEEVIGSLTPKPPKVPTRRGRNPAAETRATPPEPTAEGDSGEGEGEGAGEAEGDAGEGADEPPINTSNIVPMVPARRGRKPAEPQVLTPKGRRAAAKAADQLTGPPVTSAGPVF